MLEVPASSTFALQSKPKDHLAMKNRFKLLILLLVGTFPFIATAQSEQTLLSQLLEEEQKTIEALALYPAETRLSILEASKYPEALIKMETMKSKTSTDFKALMERYPQSIQEQAWDLTRYPGLVAAIVEGGQKWGIDFEIAVQDFPKEIVPRAREMSSDYFPLLVDIHRLDREWNSAFAQLIKEYPHKTADALRSLVDLPEVLSLLTENIRLTVLVGDLYRKNPEWLAHQMDSLGLVVAEERAKELADWKANLANDPKAEEELQAAAEAYSDEYGFDDEYYSYDDDLYYEEEDRYETPVEYPYYHHHYPYWFGYPYWYPYARWRPYPYWYDWGFYWSPNHVIIIVDLPSFWFVDWYFYQPWHHYYYPNLSRHYVNHYYGHRGSSGSISANVRNWHHRNRDIITDDWMDRARTDPNAFREFGKLETEREKYNRSHPDKPATQQQYLEKNRKKYPDLSTSVERRKEQERSTVQPPTEPKRETSRPDVQPRKEPANPTPKSRPKLDLPKVEKAERQHRDVWEKSKRETRPAPSVERQRTAPPSLKPQKQPAAPKPQRSPSKSKQKL